VLLAIDAYLQDNYDLIADAAEQLSLVVVHLWSIVIEFAKLVFENGEEPGLNGASQVAQFRQSTHRAPPWLRAAIARGRA
jgi:hypothetical protein